MIRTDRNGALWTLTLDRPDKANAMTAAMLSEMVAVLAEAAGPDGPRALVLTGTGKVFSAGADLDEARAGLARSGLWEEVSGALARLPCLTVAALNGTLAGGAFGMALACDLRLAVPEASFFYPVMKLGFLPQPSDPARLAALVGPARAKAILMAGQRIAAPEALAWGLVDRLVERAQLLPEAAALAEHACSAAPSHVAAIKGFFPDPAGG